MDRKTSFFPATGTWIETQWPGATGPKKDCDRPRFQRQRVVSFPFFWPIYKLAADLLVARLALASGRGADSTVRQISPVQTDIASSRAESAWLSAWSPRPI